MKELTGMNRREFLKNSAGLTASAMMLSLGNIYPAFASPFRLAKSVPKVTLNNGLEIPMLGFGTYSLNGEICERCVSEAISVGYRLFDTATIYNNEEFVGNGIRKSGVRRDELFITSKVWVDDSGYENAKKAFDKTLTKLGIDYLDLYLIHRPRGDYKGSWKAMEELYAAGRIKSIGVSNFESQHIQELMTVAKVTPALNQIELHPFFQQTKAQAELQKSGIKTEAWAPFAEGRNGLFTNETLTTIGRKYKKTAAQVTLRWQIQRGIITIPRTTKRAHMEENFNIFDFTLDAQDMAAIAKLDKNVTLFPEWG